MAERAIQPCQRRSERAEEGSRGGEWGAAPASTVVTAPPVADPHGPFRQQVALQGTALGEGQEFSV